MIINKFVLCALIVFYSFGCGYKQPKLSQSYLILFKTPKMKFYDKGFVNTYENYKNVQIFNAGHMVLELNIYQDEICKDSLRCISGKEFNKEFLSQNYDDDFLYKLFEKDEVYFKDKENKILIKTKKD